MGGYRTDRETDERSERDRLTRFREYLASPGVMQFMGRLGHVTLVIQFICFGLLPVAILKIIGFEIEPYLTPFMLVWAVVVLAAVFLTRDKHHPGS